MNKVSVTKAPGHGYVVWMDGREIGRAQHVWTTGGVHVWRGYHVGGGHTSNWCRTRKELVDQIVEIELDRLA
jgi:hypothetical protein